MALDEIARAANVGNATLYRLFPDRAALLRAIAVQVIGATAHAAYDRIVGLVLEEIIVDGCIGKAPGGASARGAAPWTGAWRA